MNILYEEQKSELVDALVADVAGSVAVLCDAHPDITPDEVWDRARNIVQGLIGNYRITKEITNG